MTNTQPRWTRIGLYTILTLALWAALSLALSPLGVSHTWGAVDAPIAFVCAYAMDAVERRQAARRPVPSAR